MDIFLCAFVNFLCTSYNNFLFVSCQFWFLALSVHVAFGLYGFETIGGGGCKGAALKKKHSDWPVAVF